MTSRSPRTSPIVESSSARSARLSMPRATVGVAAAAGIGALAVAAIDTRALALGLLLAGFAVVAGTVAWLESGPDRAREIVAVATLSAVASVGHVLLHPLPGVQPVTLIVVATGAALGVRAGVAVGVVSAFVSNFALGQGPWTVWQMLAWGACGAIGAALAPLLTRR